MGILCSGSFVADILVPDLPHIGSPGSLTYAPNGIHLSPGGHSANVAIDLAQLGASNVYAVGSIGEDEMGRFLLEQLRNRGVIPLPEVMETSTTAKNVALLVKGEDHRYIAELTANSLLTTKHLMNMIEKAKPSILYQGTLGGIPDIEAHLSVILNETIKQGIISFLDIIMPSNGWDYLAPALPFIDILHMNQLESKHLTGEDNPNKAIFKLIRNGVKLVIISDSRKGVTAGTSTHIIEMPAFKVTELDSTGAGDALSAGIINYIQKNEVKYKEITNIEFIIESLIEGQAAGAACVTGLGATTNVTEKKVKNLLNQQREQVKKHTRMREI